MLYCNRLWNAYINHHDGLRLNCISIPGRCYIIRCYTWRGNTIVDEKYNILHPDDIYILFGTVYKNVTTGNIRVYFTTGLNLIFYPVVNCMGWLLLVSL